MLLRATLLDAQFHYGADMLLGNQNVGGDNWFADFGDFIRGRKLGRIVDIDGLAGSQGYFENNRGRRGDQLESILPFQALLHDLHVQHPEKTAAEAEAE